MLIHCRNPHLTFVHIPKCGGMSIAYWMRQRLVEQGDPQDMKTGPGHYFLEDIQKILSDNGFTDLGFLFTIVRNPYDRAVSGYKYLQWRLENRMFERFTKKYFPRAECWETAKHERVCKRFNNCKFMRNFCDE